MGPIPKKCCKWEIWKLKYQNLQKQICWITSNFIQATECMISSRKPSDMIFIDKFQNISLQKRQLNIFKWVNFRNCIDSMRRSLFTKHVTSCLLTKENTKYLSILLLNNVYLFLSKLLSLRLSIHFQLRRYSVQLC